MVYMWLVVIILLAILEISTVNLVSIWFIISGILALIISLFVDSFLIQFGVFVVVGIILFILLRKVLTNKLVLNEKTNLDRIIGMRGVVTEDIDDLIIGEVIVDGKRWSAVAKEKIKQGEKVKVIKIEGVKLVVER